MQAFNAKTVPVRAAVAALTLAIGCAVASAPAAAA